MKKLFDLFFYKIHYKVLAFIFAILLWLLATNKEITEAEVKVKIVPVSTGNYEVIDYYPTQVYLSCEGYRKDLLILREKGVVKVLLPKVLPLRNDKGMLEIKVENLILPVSSVKVKNVTPNYLKVKVEKLIKKVVPVKLNASGVRKNLKLVLSPNYVIVYVPEKKKNKVNFVKTEKIDLSSIRENAEIYLNIESEYKVDPKRVKLSIKRREGK
ncbi:MAG: hypothetical protein ABGX27_07440 [Desulfurobacteriaceae bacterium]